MVLGVFWNVASVLVISGSGGWSMWSELECSWRACDTWAWWLWYLEWVWNVARRAFDIWAWGCGTWEYSGM